ncbi:MAG: histidine--tRNA ligase [Rhodothermales bacterium]|nr:histidine--tRNA ligase [Rhodothermales bacterium]
MSSSFKNIPGTFDVLPDTQTTAQDAVPGSPAWQYVEERIRTVMRRYGAEEIRTPILEHTELVARGIGQFTDIVSKEMFAFERGEDRYVMRPEVTAPIMRAYLQHNLAQRGGVQRLYYVGPCFRAERPQKGRYRQFHQFGLELIGTDDARADAESILVPIDVCSELGLTQYTLRINSLGRPEDRNRYRDALVEYLEPLAGKLSETSRERLQSNPLRILDTKDEGEQALLGDAPDLWEFVDDESKAHFDELRRHLDAADVRYSVDSRLVRGLDYYSRTAFELEVAGLGAQSTLAGGGRYDGLAVELGSKNPVPAVGFAAGMERLMLALAVGGAALPGTAPADIFVVALGDAARDWCFERVVEWRRSGMNAIYDLKGRSMKAQMREANRQDARTVVIVGDDELERGTVVVKDMDSGDQRDVGIDDLMSDLEKRASSG